MVLLRWVSGSEDSARTRSGIGPHLMVNLDLQKKPLLLDIGIEAELRRSSLQLILEPNFKNNLSLEVEPDLGTSLLMNLKWNGILEPASCRNPKWNMSGLCKLFHLGCNFLGKEIPGSLLLVVF